MMVVLRFNERINARDLDGMVSEWRVYEDTPENLSKIGLEWQRAYRMRSHGVR